MFVKVHSCEHINNGSWPTTVFSILAIILNNSSQCMQRKKHLPILYNHCAFSQSIYLPLSFYDSPFRRRWRHPIGGVIFAEIYFRRETRKTVSTYYRQRKSLRYLTPKNSASSTISSSLMVLILGRCAVSI